MVSSNFNLEHLNHHTGETRRAYKMRVRIGKRRASEFTAIEFGVTKKEGVGSVYTTGVACLVPSSHVVSE